MSKNSIYAIATMDTKADEILFVVKLIREQGLDVKLLDVGTRSEASEADITAKSIAEYHPAGSSAVLGLTDRGQAVGAMSEALTAFLINENESGSIAGVIGIGGGGGTSLITRAMRALPIGLPKLMVSTLASGNVAPFVGCSDITMMHSVVDVAGINKISSQVLSNAAHAIAGMGKERTKVKAENNKQTIGITMFGVTTPCADAVRKQLEAEGNDCLVFHATGTGGRTMEKLVAEGFIDSVIDITTTEVADEVVGGILSAGPERFDAILHEKVPYVLSLGALDMVNFGARSSVPETFYDRHFHVHNSEVTLMRTTAEECQTIAQWIATKLKCAEAPLTVLIPEKGVSMIDKEGEAFYDPEANQVLFDTIEAQLKDDEMCKVVRLPYHINDPEFAEAILSEYKALV